MKHWLETLSSQGGDLLQTRVAGAPVRGNFIIEGVTEGKAGCLGVALPWKWKPLKFEIGFIEATFIY